MAGSAGCPVILAMVIPKKPMDLLALASRGTSGSCLSNARAVDPSRLRKSAMLCRG
jgi:hypothetical protein